MPVLLPRYKPLISSIDLDVNPPYNHSIIRTVRDLQKGKLEDENGDPTVFAVIDDTSFFYVDGKFPKSDFRDSQVGCPPWGRRNGLSVALRNTTKKFLNPVELGDKNVQLLEEWEFPGSVSPADILSYYGDPCLGDKEKYSGKGWGHSVLKTFASKFPAMIFVRNRVFNCIIIMLHLDTCLVALS